MDSDDGGHKKKQKGKKQQEKAQQQQQTQQAPKQQADESKQSSAKALEVLYCKVCTFPPEFCYLGKKAQECREWLQTTHPEIYPTLYTEEEKPPVTEETKEGGAEESGQTVPAPPVKKKKVKTTDSRTVVIAAKMRTKTKFITTITGLELFDIKLDEARKQLAKKFASGCCVNEENKIEIQGDLTFDLEEYLPQAYPQISEDAIIVKELKIPKEPTKNAKEK